MSLCVDELRDAVREVLDSSVDIHSLAKGSGQWDELWTNIASLGWLGLSVDEPFGGLGLGFHELGVLCEELGRYLVPLPVIPSLLATHVIRLAGSQEHQQRWLAALSAGEIRVALPSVLQSALPLNADGTVTGSLRHVLDAERADEILLPVRTSDGSLALALFERHCANVLIEPQPIIDPSRTLAKVQLHAVPVPNERLLRLTDPQWQSWLDAAAVILASDAIGGARHILERTVSYMSTRKQFNRPIGSFQALKHRAASWKIQLEGVTALTRHACELLDAAEPNASATASCAKFSACDVYAGIAEDCIQLHGGIGFTWEHECHLFLKRARLNCELFGNSTHHRERVARLAFGYERRQST